MKEPDATWNQNCCWVATNNYLHCTISTQAWKNERYMSSLFAAFFISLIVNSALLRFAMPSLQLLLRIHPPIWKFLPSWPQCKSAYSTGIKQGQCCWFTIVQCNYVIHLWALSTLETILAVGSERELPHVVSNRESGGLSLCQVFGSEFRFNFFERQRSKWLDALSKFVSN